MAYSSNFIEYLTLTYSYGNIGFLRCGVEQWQLVGLITRRSQVQVLPPLLTRSRYIRGLRFLRSERKCCIRAIAPGYMATYNTAQLRADPTRSTSILERIPAGRWGTPDDLKGAVVFLASP